MYFIILTRTYRAIDLTFLHTTKVVAAYISSRISAKMILARINFTLL